MTGSTDDGPERSERRQHSVNSPLDQTHERRRRDDDRYSSSRRRHENHQSSHQHSSRRRSSRSPAEKTNSRSDRDRPRRERRDRSTSLAGEDHDRHRHRSHRHRDTRHEDEDRSSRRHRHMRSRSRSRSPQKSRSPPPRALERRGPLPSQSDAFTDVAHPADAAAPEKQKPNFNATGRLAAESNTIQVQGGAEIVLKYHEPPEARKPPSKEAWRMYVFKGQDLLETVELGERSCWLVGRERMVVDFPLDHPSCSKQHAVLQFRFVEKRNEYGDRIGKIKPYLIDLESANGSSVNGETIPAGRYVEVMDKDVIRFGLSSREYVLMLPPT
ncbi:SMAD/FHA domain [Penicillium digitatum]|uniref:SMAD/FHA domain n=1 Tax=Penicillium digitatum TaxID=36651 RepID=A0A7T7BP47_PENDI|nr:SMAD/FHA domain [Penicillium digitatum]